MILSLGTQESSRLLFILHLPKQLIGWSRVIHNYNPLSHRNILG